MESGRMDKALSAPFFTERMRMATRRQRPTHEEDRPSTTIGARWKKNSHVFVNESHVTGGKRFNTRRVVLVLILFICISWVQISLVFLRNIPAPQKTQVQSHPSRKDTTEFTNNNHHDVTIISSRKNSINPRTSSPYRIVHSLTTRFMLGQKGQPTLARARYLLFETFCYPTVRSQTEGYEFHWFVLVDPGIDNDVLEDMRALLQQTPTNFPNGNAYLIATENPSWAADGVGVPGVTSYGAGFQEVAKAVRDGSVEVLAGNVTRLVKQLERDFEISHGKSVAKNEIAPPLMIIETMLDADDGLNNRALEWIQELAVSHIQQQQNLHQPHIRSNSSPSLDSTWWLLCGTDHVEWHNRDIFRLTERQYEKQGLSSGIVGLRHAPQYCASAGFTRVGLTSRKALVGTSTLQFPEVAYSNHALATEEFDICRDTGGNITLSHCFRRDFPDVPFVLKSRSITSDSMDHMDPRRKDYRDLPWETPKDHPLLGLNDTEKMWGIVTKDFSIDREKAWKTSVYMRENLEEILKENKQSRCAPGFPCREVADVAFKKMSAHVQKLKQANKVQRRSYQGA